jgi:hypothetical protein
MLIYRDDLVKRAFVPARTTGLQPSLRQICAERLYSTEFVIRR